MELWERIKELEEQKSNKLQELAEGRYAVVTNFGKGGLIFPDLIDRDETITSMVGNVIQYYRGQMDLIAHIRNQRAWSLDVFGPGGRVEGILDHILMEMVEVEEPDGALMEWIDIILLALDGAWRCGNSPEEIAGALMAKQQINENREWPDWRTAEPGRAIEHIRDGWESIEEAEEALNGGPTGYTCVVCGYYSALGIETHVCHQDGGSVKEMHDRELLRAACCDGVQYVEAIKICRTSPMSVDSMTAYVKTFGRLPGPAVTGPISAGERTMGDIISIIQDATE